jgi:hypothetical protein
MSAPTSHVYVYGWFFDGWGSEDTLYTTLRETLDFVNIHEKSVIVESSPDLIRITFPSIRGSSQRIITSQGVEEQVHIFLVAHTRLLSYELGRFIKEKLDLVMINRGFFQH